MAEFIASLLIIIGAVFVFVGSLAMLRFPDFLTRLHGPTKATTLGLAGLLGGFMVHAANSATGLSFREILITAILFITAPLSAHMLGRAAIRLRVRSIAPLPEPLTERERRRE